MASIEELKSLISSKNGLAMANQFLIQIPGASTLNIPGLSNLPFNVPAIDNALNAVSPTLGELIGGVPQGREMDLLCKTTTIPGKQILTRERGVGMQPELIAYGYADPDVSMSFHLLNDYGVMRFFEGWKRKIINEETSEVGYKLDYQRDIKIHQLRKPVANKSVLDRAVDIVLGNDTIVYSVVLENAFPTSIQEVALSNELDALSELTVQLSYTNVKVLETSLLRGVAKMALGPILDKNISSLI